MTCFVMPSFFLLPQEDTLEEAIATMTDKGVKQPVLLRVNGRYYVKADATAIPIANCSCFAQAVEFLFVTFYVFGVEYPPELRFFFGFIEHVLGMTLTVGKSSTLSNLLRVLSAISSHQSSDSE